MTGMPGRGCRGGASPTPQIWAEQLTLSIIQGGGQIMPSIVLLVPPRIFRPFNIPEMLCKK